MKTAIVTGGNGFIGARLVHRLLEHGWSVQALGLPEVNASYRERLETALTDITGNRVERKILQNLHCHGVDISDFGLGLSRPISENLNISDAVLFHVAGDISFNPPDPEKQRQVNISGTLNVIRNLHDVVSSVVHVSTAYVAGDRQGLVLESETDKGQSFHNAYEKSKLDAELAATGLCCELKLPLAIVRPSIIINDMKTGRSSTFTHLNALVEVIDRIQKHYGISDGESVSKLIRIPFGRDCCPNLAPVDPIVEAIFEIGISKHAAGRTFHLCHPDPMSNNRLLSLIAESFGVKDKIKLDFVAELPSWTERMIIRSLKPYLPYMQSSCKFDLTNTISVIPDYCSRFPSITLKYLRKVIEFQRRK